MREAFFFNYEKFNNINIWLGLPNPIHAQIDPAGLEIVDNRQADLGRQNWAQIQPIPLGTATPRVAQHWRPD